MDAEAADAAARAGWRRFALVFLVVLAMLVCQSRCTVTSWLKMVRSKNGPGGSVGCGGGVAVVGHGNIEVEVVLAHGCSKAGGKEIRSAFVPDEPWQADVSMIPKLADSLSISEPADDF